MLTKTIFTFLGVLAETGEECNKYEHLCRVARKTDSVL